MACRLMSLITRSFALSSSPASSSSSPHFLFLSVSSLLPLIWNRMERWSWVGGCVYKDKWGKSFKVRTFGWSSLLQVRLVPNLLLRISFCPDLMCALSKLFCDLWVSFSCTLFYLELPSLFVFPVDEYLHFPKSHSATTAEAKIHEIRSYLKSLCTNQVQNWDERSADAKYREQFFKVSCGTSATSLCVKANTLYNNSANGQNKVSLRCSLTLVTIN